MIESIFVNFEVVEALIAYYGETIAWCRAVLRRSF